MKRLIFIVPIVLFGVLAYFLFKSLIGPAPDVLKSALIDKPAPRLTLPALDAQTRGFGPAQLTAGHVTVVNVFGSWCPTCREEAPVLPMLAHLKDVKLYGMVYMDTPAKARKFLDEVGNPFSRIGLDESGHAGIEWGVYGAPETFVVDGKGIVRLRHVGALTPSIIHNEIIPAIDKAKADG